MGIFEIISAIILIVSCVFIVIVVLMKETKTQMSQTISGTSSDSFYQKNAGRTKEAMLNKATITAAIVFFVLALAVNVINVYFGGSSDSDSSSSDSSNSIVTDAEETSDLDWIYDYLSTAEADVVITTAEAAAEGAATAEAENAAADDNSAADDSATENTASETAEQVENAE
jgi:preprotein translocase subunit SecG